MSLGWVSPYEFRKVDGHWERRLIGERRWERLEVVPGGARRSSTVALRWRWR